LTGFYAMESLVAEKNERGMKVIAELSYRKFLQQGIENRFLGVDFYFYWIQGSDNTRQNPLTLGVKSVKKIRAVVGGGGGREVGSGA
jgi:hypothetical protein